MNNKEIKLELVKEGDFLGTKCNFYKDEDNNVYMTREQIGQALKYSNPQKAIDNIHSRNKERLNKFSVTLKLRATDGKQYNTTLYTEKGIYDICRFSKQPIADQFYDWVYEQIQLIRKTGGAIDDKELFIETYCAGLDEGMKALIKGFMNRVEEQQRQIKEMQPKVEDWEAFMDSKGNMTMAKVAKALNIEGIGRNKLFAILREKGILRENNEPYQRYVDEGYFEIGMIQKNGFKVAQTLVTGKGMSFINKKLKEWGYVS